MEKGAEMSKEISVVNEVRNGLEAMKPQFAAALPGHIRTDKFVRVVNTVLQNNPSLLELDRRSLYSACMRSAQDGLLPNGVEAAIVPFKGLAQYMPMVAGILKKVRNSGELKSITAQMIYTKDRFRYYVDSEGEHLEHEPNLFEDRGSAKGVYALATTKDGGVYIEVLSPEQVNAIRSMSRSKTNSPWDGPFAEEMWKKSALRRLAKRLPSSTDIDDFTAEHDEDFQVQATPAPTPQPQPTPEKTSSRLAEAVAEDNLPI